MPPLNHRLRLRHAAVLVLAGAVLSGCAGGFSGSGDGFGGFGASRQPAAEADGYTMRRLTGQPDTVGTLEPDLTVSWPATQDAPRPSIFETDEERRAREAQQPRRRGSSSESRQVEPPLQPSLLPREAPRAVAPPPPVDSRGRAIPGAPAGTVTTGQTGNVGTFGGPAGSGTTLRDGGTTTLMGADGTIRTVPTPR